MERELELYYLMKLTRELEQRVSKLHIQNKILGGVYSGFGQEAVVVGTSYGLQPGDVVLPLHRDLGVFLTRGVSPRRLMAQLFGKETGLSRGKDSFLHGGDMSKGVFGATSMLASTLPVACGMALAFRARQAKNVAVAFFGEGASSRGDTHEALNFAGVHKLPVIFVCENNRYAFSTPQELQMAIEDVADRALGYGMKGLVCSGNDLHAVLETMGRAVTQARGGGGPTLVECKTYRIGGHSEHDRAAYRTQEELLEWAGRDPIRRWEMFLEVRGRNVPEIRREIDEKARAVVDDAVRFAEQSPDPQTSEALEDLYAMPLPLREREPEAAPSPAPPSEEPAPGWRH